MARRSNHYEAAFEDYARSRGWPYVPVDEQRKAIFAGSRIKSFDFLVYPQDGSGKTWLVDVKGRKFPYECAGGPRYWENWVTREDLEGLSRWRGAFGDGFEPVLLFAYWLLAPPWKEPTQDVHLFQGRYYAFFPVFAEEYAEHARRRSPKWGTVSVATRRFRSLVRPFSAEGRPIGNGSRPLPVMSVA